MARTRALSRIHKTVGRWHTDIIHVLQPTSSVGQYGEQLNDHVTAEVVKGRIIGLRKKDYEDYGLQEGATTTYRVSLPRGTVVKAGYALEVNGIVMDVVGLDQRLTDGADVQVLVVVRNA